MNKFFSPDKGSLDFYWQRQLAGGDYEKLHEVFVRITWPAQVRLEATYEASAVFVGL